MSEMAQTEEQIVADLRKKQAERQWIENYKKYARRIAKAKAELTAEGD